MDVEAIIAECRRLVARKHKPSLLEVRPIVEAYYMLPGGGAGGELHTVLDDGNYSSSSIRWSIEWAKREETRALGALLLMLSNSQRRRLC